MRNAGDTGGAQDIRRRRLIVGDAMRHRAVQSDIIAERATPLRTALHHHQPAVGSDLDRDVVAGAIASQGFQKYPLAGAHRRSVIPVTVGSKAARYTVKDDVNPPSARTLAQH